MKIELDSYEIFPTRQIGGEALAVFLEPESKHGLHRFAAAQLPLIVPSWYPVLRVFDGKTSTAETPAPPLELEPLDGSFSQ